MSISNVQVNTTAKNKCTTWNNWPWLQLNDTAQELTASAIGVESSAPDWLFHFFEEKGFSYCWLFEEATDFGDEQATANIHMHSAGDLAPGMFSAGIAC